MPYIAVQERLNPGGTMDCDKCKQAIRASQRAHMGCGWLPADERLSTRGRPLVPGIKPSSDPAELCPYYCASLPQVHEAAVAWLWRDKGQLQMRYHRPADILLDAIDIYHGAVMGAQDYMQERMRERNNAPK